MDFLSISDRKEIDRPLGEPQRAPFKGSQDAHSNGPWSLGPIVSDSRLHITGGVPGSEQRSTYRLGRRYRETTDGHGFAYS